MKRPKAKISLISVGDKVDFDSFKKLHRERKRFNRSCISYRALSYKDLLNGDIPKIKAKAVLFFFFFPFDYWNKHIEPRNYKGIYGNTTFYKKFVGFFKSVNSSIKKNFSGKKIFFINSPALSARYRDKLAVKRLLKSNDVTTPPLYGVTVAENIYKYLAKGSSFFIKQRYGSMGKGITFISPLVWKTNFVFRKRRILSRKSDYGWRFRNITEKEIFLKKLSQSSIYIEGAVDSYFIKGKKFDLRVYILFNKVLFIYPKSNDPGNITTNISQEGQGEYPAFLRPIPKSVIDRVKREALKTTKVLGLNFAGVDVIIDKRLKNIYIIDVNIFPGFPKKRIFNLAKHLVQELKSQAILRYL